MEYHFEVRDVTTYMPITDKNGSPIKFETREEAIKEYKKLNDNKKYTIVEVGQKAAQ